MKNELKPRIEWILDARKNLKKSQPIPQDIAIGLDLAFLPYPLTMTNLFFGGELTHSRMLDYLRRMVGYFMMSKLEELANTKNPRKLHEEIGMTAYDLGNAFIWNLSGCLAYCTASNPFIGHEDVMKGILVCKPNMKLVRKYEALYRKNGHTNPAAQKAIAALK